MSITVVVVKSENRNFLSSDAAAGPRLDSFFLISILFDKICVFYLDEEDDDVPFQSHPRRNFVVFPRRRG